MIKLVSYRSDITEFEVGDVVEYSKHANHLQVGTIVGFDSEHYSVWENQQSPQLSVMIVFQSDKTLSPVRTMGSAGEPTIDDEKLLEGYEDYDYDWCEPKHLKLIKKASRIKTIKQILREL